MFYNFKKLILILNKIFKYSNIDYNKSQRNLVKYDRIDFEDFIAQTITNCYNLCNFYFTLLFNESFIDVVD